jgi:protein-S-isoprenylcysteine O-methyltransferase Ste14
MSPWMLLPPPFLFVIPLIVGLELGRVWRMPIAPKSLADVVRVLGGALLAAGVALILSPPVFFALNRTTILPHGRARKLITAGPFRITRNPMYLGMTCFYLGATLWMNTLWPLALLVLPLWIISTKTIPFEEATLTRVFGDEYRAYQKRVRRWL